MGFLGVPRDFWVLAAASTYLPLMTQLGISLGFGGSGLLGIVYISLLTPFIENKCHKPPQAFIFYRALARSAKPHKGACDRTTKVAQGPWA